MWNADELLNDIRDGLRDHAGGLDREQAVHGLDALSELELHPVIARSLARHGSVVLREQPYPGDVHRRAKQPERERCDLVLLPPGAERLLDPVRELLARDAASGTLFASVEPLPDPGAVAPDAALWIEIKSVGQYAHSLGVPGQNRTYTSELIGGITADLRKLAAEPMITAGALVLVLFTADETIAEHDLAAAVHRAIDRGVGVRSIRRVSFGITERIGNLVCSVAWLEARREEA